MFCKPNENFDIQLYQVIVVTTIVGIISAQMNSNELNTDINCCCNNTLDGSKKGSSIFYLAPKHNTFVVVSNIA